MLDDNLVKKFLTIPFLLSFFASLFIHLPHRKTLKVLCLGQGNHQAIIPICFWRSQDIAVRLKFFIFYLHGVEKVPDLIKSKI